MVAAAKKFLSQLLNAAVRDKSNMGTLICLVVGGFCVLTWIARVIARLSMASAGQWGSDDWVMAAAMVRQNKLAGSRAKTDLSQVIVIPLTFCAYICKFH